MAHIGRIYELANRRDLNINCTDYALGLAKQYVARFNFTDQFGGFWRIQTPYVDCSIVGDTWSTNLRWDSEHFYIGEQEWQFRLSILFVDNARGAITFDFQVWKDAQWSATWQMSNSQAGRCHNIGVFVGGFMSDAWDPSLWQTWPRIFGGGYGAKKWNGQPV